MKQAQEIESVLRRLLADQRKAIEKDAPFVYETDVFAGGVITSGPSRVVIGKWTVNILGETAKARIEKRFGSSGRFESEVIEVEMLFQDGSVVVRDWRAYQGRGSIN